MKKIIALLLFTLITTISVAQCDYQDVVHLKSGNIIKGIIIEQIPNKSIKIETTDKSVFEYQIDEIAKFTKEVIPKKDKLSNIGMKKGYKGMVELGGQIGIAEAAETRMKINIINGYQINPYLSLGIGTGMRFYIDLASPVIPVFADVRANFLNKKISPYLSLGVGYSFDASDGITPLGILLNPNIGVSFKILEKSALNLGVGYDMQEWANYYRGNHYSNVSRSENLSAVCITAGMSF